MLDEDVLVKAINTFGPRSQMDVLIEEMSELAKEIIKARRAVWPDVEKQPITEGILKEFVDVTICLDQLYMMLVACHENNRDVFDRVYSYHRTGKMNRLLMRIREFEATQMNRRKE
jgi:endo-1,4-beta-D-glucanase Y